MRKYAFASIVAAVVVATTLVFTLSSEATGTLIGHWTFDDGLAADISGNGNNGVVNGAILAAGKVGAGSLNFDGTDDHVDLGTLDPDGTAVTLAAWINADNLANCVASDCRIASKANGTGEQDHYIMLSTIASGGGVKLRLRLKAGGTTTTLIASSGNLTDGVWTHVAATYDGSFMRVYVDGVEVGSVAKTGLMDSEPAVPFWIGGNPDSPTSRPWDGKIDDVRLYDGALSLAEIEALAGSTIPPAPEPPIDISGLDYRGADFTRDDLSNGRFVGANLTGATLLGTNLSNADLRDVIFDGGVLRYANLTGADLRGIHLQPNLATHGVRFDGANLSDVVIVSGLNGDGMSFTNIVMDNGRLQTSVLTGADFSGAIMTNSNVSDTDFTAANFTNADLTGTNMDLAISTSGAIWSNTICPDGTNSDVNGWTCEGHLRPQAPAPNIVSLSPIPAVTGDPVLVTIEGFTPFSTVRFFVGTSPELASVQVGDDGRVTQFGVIIPVPGGTYTFTAEEVGSGLNASAPLVVAPSSGGTFPIVEFLNPVGDITTSDEILNDIRVKFTAVGNGISQTRVTNTATGASGGINADCGNNLREHVGNSAFRLIIGDNVIEARATDCDGNVSVEAVKVTRVAP